MSPRRRACREAWLRDPHLLGEALQFAISRVLLARAWRRMIGHQQFDESSANA